MSLVKATAHLAIVFAQLAALADVTALSNNSQHVLVEGARHRTLQTTYAGVARATRPGG